MTDRHSIRHDGPPAPAKMIFIASHFGDNFIQNIKSAGSYGDLMSSRPGHPPHVTQGLLFTGGRPVLEYWLNSAAASERLATGGDGMLGDRFHIITNGDNYLEYVSWVGRWGGQWGIGAANVHSTGAQITEPRRGALVDLAWLIQKEGFHSDTLVVVEGHAIFEPEFNLVRVIEYAQVRGKDCVAYHTPREGWNLETEVSVTLDDYETANPRITGVNLEPKGRTDGKTPLLAPLFVFRRGSIPDILAAATTKLPIFRQLFIFFEQQWSLRHKPIFAIKHEIYFNVHWLADWLLGDNFFKHLAKVRADEAAHVQPPVRKTNINFVAAEHPLTTGKVPQPAHISDIFEAWLPIYTASQGVTVQNEKGMVLPERFTDPSIWAYRHKKKAHPFYNTSSDTNYGARLPAVIDMPTVYTPSNYKFTTSFTTPIRIHTVNTQLTKTRICNVLPENWL